MGTLYSTKEARIYSGEKTAPSISGAGKTGQLHAKERHSFTPYTKMNSKWIKDLNVRPETINLLEENIGRTLFDINQSNIFFHLSLRVIEIQTKINKWNLINSKAFVQQRKPQIK